MIKVFVGDLATRKQFVKEFDSPYLAKRFIERAERGNKLIILGWEGKVYDD